MKRLVKRYMAVFLSMTMLVCMPPESVVVSAAVSDVNGHWAQSMINKWISLDYISGYPDGTFQPDKPISRAEFVVLVNRAFHVANPVEISFSDVPSGYWAYGEIQKGVGRGYVKGNGNGLFRPESMVTRQEASVMLTLVKGLSENAYYTADYSDSSQISDWARGYVGAVTQAGIMKGFPDGSFHPLDKITRAETVIAVDKALSASAGSTASNNTTAVPQKPTTTVAANNNTNTVNTSTSSVNSMTLGAGDTTLKDKVIKGDLIISKEVGSDNVLLTNVTVEGTVILEGGGKITAENCKLNKVVFDKSSIELNADNLSNIKETVFNKDGTISGKGFQDVKISGSAVSSVTIDAQVNNLTLDKNARVKLNSKADIKTFDVTDSAGNASIVFASGASVNTMNVKSNVRITGKDGDIDTMNVYVDDVRSDIKPDTLETKDGAEKPTYTKSYSSKNSSTSSRYNYDDLVLDDDDDDFDGDGDYYDEVRIEAEDVTLKDVVVDGNLRIEREAANSDIRIDDTKVKGKTYIYGGKNIEFNNCDFEGDIISDTSKRKGSSSKQDSAVILEFDEDCDIDGRVRILGNTKLITDGKRSVEIPDVVIENALSEEMLIDADIESLEIQGKVNLRIKSGRRIDTLKINGNADGTVITMEGSAVIDRLSSYSQIEIAGKGKVNTITTNKDITIGSDIESGTVTKPESVPVTGITLSSAAASVGVGKQVKITASVVPDTASNKTVTWSSSNTSIATVNNGAIVGVKEGTATITAKTQDGGFSAACQVTVSQNGGGTTPDEPVNPDDPVNPDNPSGTEAVTGVAVTPNPTTVKPGSTVQLTATVQPENAANKNVTWKTSNGLIASVDANGLVTGVKEGTAKITATTEDGAKTADCLVTVKSDTISVTEISIIPEEATIRIGTTRQLTADIKPDNAENKEVNWKSSSTIIAMVDTKGVVTGVREGTAMITATTADGGHTASAMITVVKKLDGDLDTAPLDNAIQAANDAKNSVTVAKEAIEVSKGKQWVLQEEMDALKEAIKEANDNWGSLTTQAQIQMQADKLNQAVELFISQKKDGTSVTADNSDRGPLNQLINEATRNKNETEVSSTFGDDVPTTLYWVSNIVANIYAQAISAAETITNDTKSTQAQVKKAIESLQAATEEFNKAKAPGKLELDLTALKAAIEEAKTKKDGVLGSAAQDGSDIPIYKYWVTNDILNGYNAKINIASAALTSKDQAEINRVTNELKKFAFNPQRGRQRCAIDEALDEATVFSETTVKWMEDSYSVDDASAKVENGERWAYVSEKNKLDKAIDKATLAKADVTSDADIVAIAKELRDAITAVPTYTGIKPVDLTNLKKDIDLAEQNIDGTNVSATGTGSEYLENQYWVTNSEKTEYQKAIEQARKIYDTPNLLRKEVDKAITDLATATDKFNAAKKKGLKILVSGVSLSDTTLNLEANKKGSLTATVAPNNATNKAVKWSSSNDDVATVVGDGTIGTVSAIAPGTAIITVTTEDGGHTASCTVNVGVVPTKIELSETAFSINVEEKRTITAKVLPDEATNQEVTWTSSNIATATVTQDGEVTGLKKGTVTITATSKADTKVKATCKVTITDVNIPVTGVKITNSTTTGSALEIGATMTMNALVEPYFATNKAVEWMVNDTNIATINKTSGALKGVGEGVVEVTVITKDGGFTDKFNVTVVPKAKAANYLLTAPSAKSAPPADDQTPAAVSETQGQTPAPASTDSSQSTVKTKTKDRDDDDDDEDDDDDINNEPPRSSREEKERESRDERWGRNTDSKNTNSSKTKKKSIWSTRQR